MSYMHISNLEKAEAQQILEFKRLWALEKIHGTSGNISLKNGQFSYFAGDQNPDQMRKTFPEDLEAKILEIGVPEVTIYGEAYGGKSQGMKASYGDVLRFIAFDVQIGDSWLAVPQAVRVVERVGLEFVPYSLVSSDLAVLEAERDKPSEIAVRRGMGVHPREGVVLRPPFEVTTNDGERLIAKFKGAAFRETTSVRKVEVDPNKRVVLEAAQAIADEYVVEMRLNHVLQKIEVDGKLVSMQDTVQVIAAMTEDVYREAKGEIVESKEVAGAIGKKTAKLLKELLSARLKAPAK